MSRYEVDPLTLIDLLEQQCSADPDRVVYTLLDGESEAGRLTCGELWCRTRAVAAALQASCDPGERVLLLYPTGLDFIAALFGCIAAGLIAVPASPPDPARRKRTLPRLVSMVRDAEPSLVLAASEILSGLEEVRADVPELAALRWQTLDNLVPLGEPACDWTRPEIDGNSLAYLQYTSGSTASPKGVMVTHGNLLHNSRLIHQAWRYGPDSIDLSWVPNFHDDGLVHAILQPLYCGGRSYLMEPMAFVGRPVRWLEAISRYRATHSGGPDFAYALCARKINAEQRAGLDLASWQLAYNAAEPVRRETLEAFTHVFEPCGFNPQASFPSFGMAETTLLVTTARWGSRPTYLDVDIEQLEQRRQVVETPGRGRAFVGCGPPVADTEVVIARPETGERCAPDEVGELWIASGSVASGYWRRPKETERTFGAQLVGGSSGQRYLRTGDLGFLAGGELFITGRQKDLIIIRGRNIYPQDIEKTAVACHPTLRPGCGAAFGIEHQGEERLVVVHEASDRATLDAGEVAEVMRRQLAEEHDVQLAALVLIRPRTIPKTSSGKIQRYTCRAEFLAGDLDEIDSWGYRPPLVNAAPSVDAALDPMPDTCRRRAELLEWLRSFAGERIDWQQIDERRSFPPHLVLELGNRGLLGLQAPLSDGGLALDHADFVRVLEQLGAIDLTLATFVTGHNVLGLRPIQRFAAGELQQLLVPALAQGRELAAFALTEPGAGSNPHAIAAVAKPDGAGWRLHGRKLWSGSAGWAGVINVFVQLLDGDGRRRGIAGFMVRPGSDGLSIGSESATMGLRGMTQNAIHLDGVPVSPAELLGEPGDGMAVAEDAMLFTRLCLAAISVGGTKRCAQLMLRYAARRLVATGRLLDNPVTLARLGELVSEVTALEALVSETARSLDDGRPVPKEVFAALKVAGPELLWRAADSLVQLLGGRGYLENNLAPRMLRDARVFRIFEGPTEAIQMWLGASVDRDLGALDSFLRERLAAVAPADSLRLAVRHSAARIADSSDRVAARRWNHFLIGDVATAAVLWAAAEAAASGAGARRAVEWARSRCEAAVARASASLAEAVLYGADEVGRAIEGFAAEIGNCEPAVAGMESGLDPLLARSPEAPAASGESLTATEEPPSAAVEGSAAAAVEAWLVDWCRRELGIEANDIDVRQPFVNLGLDSVTAVALADQLGAWLGRPIQRTLVWQYPSIAAVSRYLGGEEPGAGTGAAKETPADVEMIDLLSEVEQLSDEEAKSALSAERRR